MSHSLRFLRRLMAAAWMAAAMGWLTSCGDEAQGADVPHQTASLNLAFTLPRTTGDEYEEGNSYENYIDIEGGNYRIYFFDTDNKLIAQFNPSSVIPAEGSNYTRYSVLGEVPAALTEHSSLKMMVIANWPRYPNVTAGTTTIDDICKATQGQYDCLKETELNPNNGKLMPFYGIRQYDNVTFKPDVATILSEPVTLLRAMAKVEVILKTDQYYDLSFASLQMHRYNAKGYCAPDGIDHQDKYDHNGTWAEDYVKTLHLVNDANDPGAKSFKLTKVDRTEDADGNITELWRCYVPEYQNIGAGDNYASLKAKFNVQLTGDDAHTIYFANYSEGTTDNDDTNGAADYSDTRRLNIERNNIYRFTVQCKGYNYQLQLTVSDWAGVYENVFEYGKGQIASPIAPWEDETNIEIEF